MTRSLGYAPQPAFRRFRSRRAALARDLALMLVAAALAYLAVRGAGGFSASAPIRPVSAAVAGAAGVAVLAFVLVRARGGWELRIDGTRLSMAELPDPPLHQVDLTDVRHVMVTSHPRRAERVFLLMHDGRSAEVPPQLAQPVRPLVRELLRAAPHVTPIHWTLPEPALLDRPLAHLPWQEWTSRRGRDRVGA